MKPALLATFRVYPAGRYFYATVNIWRTKRDMYAHKPLQRNHEASCTGQKAYNFSGKAKGRKTGLFCEINLHQKRLGAEIVSHEFTHAMFCFAERKRLDLDAAVHREWRVKGKGRTLLRDGPEEECCYALGRMYRQFVDRCYKLGIYK